MTRARRLPSILAAALIGLAATGGAQAGADRVALLIGNADYAGDLLDLANPLNDAEALGAALAALGFEVHVVADATGAEMRRAVIEAAARMEDAEIGLVFYAGHGMQIAGENHLVGADFSGRSREALFDSSVTLGFVRAALSVADPALGIVILDACRDNPLGVDGRPIADDDGLGDAGLVGAGLLVAYATDPGDVAADGAGDNGVFTEALLRHAATPSLDVRLMFGRVRQDVVLATRGRQVPWVQESVLGRFSLNSAPAPPAVEDAVREDVAAWRRAGETGTRAAYAAYVAAHPDGLFADVARDRLSGAAAGGAVPASADESVETFLAAAQPERLGRSLAVLGLLPVEAEAEGWSPEALRRGTLDYLAAREAEGATATPAAVFADAARRIVFSGARLARRLRTDMVALQAVEQAQAAARSAWRQLETLSEESPAAKALLAQADRDLEAIEASRVKVLARLDQTRAYYDDLLAIAGAHYRGLVDVGLVAPGDAGASRELASAEADALRDARLFVRHVRVRNDPQAPGSMSWLADFLPRG